MTPKETEVQTINIGGLRGRMLQLPSSRGKHRNILLIYGLHSSIERMYTSALFLNRFGAVTMPDLPGFGGMDSFYKIGKEPSLDSYADFLYTFLKSQKLTSDITLVSMSFGSLISTRLFQKYPETTKYITDYVAVVGWGRPSDFALPWLVRGVLSPVLTRLFSTRVGAFIVSRLVFNPLSLRIMFALFRLFNPKYQHALSEQRKAAQAMELELWQNNDARTKFYTWNLIRNYDLTKNGPPIKLSIINMYTDTDQYFDRRRVEESLKLLYTDYRGSVVHTAVHAPSVLGPPEEIDQMYSSEIKELLSRS